MGQDNKTMKAYTKIKEVVLYQEPMPKSITGIIWYHAKWFVLGVFIGFVLGWIFLS